ncbi:hypothetical protein KC19_5G191900 [Ceratodon purpureus]|uniref:Uncharacterized protein n=1 Tax=Ceratodon purpureus TaxID=3225 RepID=A0A8T0I686_CERPU|nr:hypothetical protein KC19_5G191900 [Ceratodon purpureus]
MIAVHVELARPVSQGCALHIPLEVAASEFVESVKSVGPPMLSRPPSSVASGASPFFKHRNSSMTVTCTVLEHRNLLRGHTLAFAVGCTACSSHFSIATSLLPPPPCRSILLVLLIVLDFNSR